MTQEFTKPGAGERVKQLGFLLKNTVTIIGRDTGIVGPWRRAAVYAAVMVTLFFAAIFAIAVDRGGLGTLLLVVALLMFVYKYFFYVRQDMAQSWLVAESVRGRKASLADARKRVGGLRGRVWVLGWCALLFAYIGSKAAQESKGIKGLIVKVTLWALTEVWDLARHFLTPAVTVDDCSLKEGVGKMKDLRHAVPETLVGVFGIDIAGGAAGTLITPVYTVLIVLAIGAGLLVGDSFAAFHFGDLGEMFSDSPPAWLDGRHFSWLPLLVALWLCKLLGAVLQRVVESLKNIYFTLFYMRLAHAEEIAPELQGELEGFLKMERPEEAAASS